MRRWILASEYSAFACKSLWRLDFLMCEEEHLILLWSCIFFCVWSPRSSSSESVSWGNSMRGNRGGATRKWSSSAERRRGDMQRENRFIHLVEHHIKTLLLYPDRQYGATEICQNLPLNFLLFSISFFVNMFPSLPESLWFYLSSLIMPDSDTENFFVDRFITIILSF